MSSRDLVRMREKRGQVWVETVLYTLIGLALIGLVLTFTLPKINEAKDKAVVNQAITSLNDLDEKINAVSSVAGNKRFIEFTVGRGELFFDVKNDKIIYRILDLVKPYSEPGANVTSGRITIFSEEGQKESSVSLTIEYLDFYLTFDEADEDKKFTAAPTPYRFSVENNGFIIIPPTATTPEQTKIIIDVSGG